MSDDEVVVLLLFDNPDADAGLAPAPAAESLAFGSAPEAINLRWLPAVDSDAEAAAAALSGALGWPTSGDGAILDRFNRRFGRLLRPDDDSPVKLAAASAFPVATVVASVAKQPAPNNVFLPQLILSTVCAWLMRSPESPPEPETRRLSPSVAYGVSLRSRRE